MVQFNYIDDDHNPPLQSLLNYGVDEFISRQFRDQWS